MRKLYILLFAFAGILKLSAQTTIPATATPPAPAKGNYMLAARFSPKKIAKMVFSTATDPHWLKLSDRFWYMYETSEGRKWYIADAAYKPKKYYLITLK